ncbi:MAG: hypothetical protein GX221_09285 [Candidatus Riflebacteria bacterium]|mgnify:CR=1 FL=1|nr:hypothetical protein [Candidatus Riflebacteria bacterium]
MIQDMSKVAFYFMIECANCRNATKVSHVYIKDKEGTIDCALCGKEIIVPGYEKVMEAAETMNAFLSDTLNAQFVTLVNNEKFVKPVQEIA